MMGIAQRAVRHSPADSHNLYISAVVANVVPNLLKAPQRGEVADAVRKDDVARQGQTGTNAC